MYYPLIIAKIMDPEALAAIGERDLTVEEKKG